MDYLSSGLGIVYELPFMQILDKCVLWIGTLLLFRFDCFKRWLSLELLLAKFNAAGWAPI